MFDLGGAQAVFTNRVGGGSTGAYATLNLGDHVGDDPAVVARNRKIVDEAIGRKVVWMHQTHSNRVAQVHPGYTDSPADADGIIIDTREFAELGLATPAAGVMVADCVPLLLASDDGLLVAAVHAGRAGMVTGIVREAVIAMRKLGAQNGKIHAAIGPAICGACYEVPEAMRTHVTGHVPAAWSRTRVGSPGLDLQAGVISQLRTAGVRITFASKRCTFEDRNLYSYRRDGVTGRFAGIVVGKGKVPAG